MKNKPAGYRLFSVRMIKPTILILIISITNYFWLHHIPGYTTFDVLDSAALFILSTIFTQLIAIIQQFYHSKTVLNLTNISSLVLIAGITILVLHFFEKILLPDTVFHRSFSFEIHLLRSIFILLTFSVILLIYWIDRQLEIEERIKQYAIEKERELRHQELIQLQQQLQPHFIFNSLNSINALTLSQPEEARKMIQQLSDFLRGTLKLKEQTFNTFEDEVMHLRRYIEIEKIRFGHRLEVNFNIGEDCLPTKIPALLLQPAIENAIKFGLYGSVDYVLIIIDAKLIDGILNVWITNPFEGHFSGQISGTGYGLRSLDRKLRILFQRSDLMKKSISENKFTLHLIIPQ